MFTQKWFNIAVEKRKPAWDKKKNNKQLKLLSWIKIKIKHYDEKSNLSLKSEVCGWWSSLYVWIVSVNLNFHLALYFQFKKLIFLFNLWLFFKTCQKYPIHFVKFLWKPPPQKNYPLRKAPAENPSLRHFWIFPNNKY